MEENVVSINFKENLYLNER